jgi:A/G-specific adenine glycosylase
MLQQTQVVTVIPYFEKFVARFPCVEDLAQAPLEEVLMHWAGLGYYSRARNLHRGAQKIAREGFPKNREEWMEVPGVGQYTAGAILSIASDQPEPILDGNVERVLSRVRRVSRQRGESHFKARLWRLSRIFVQTAHHKKIKPSVLNQAMMELGATVCIPKKPHCEICPLRNLCLAYSFGEQELFPPKKKPKDWVQVREKLHCVIRDTDRVLLQQRKKGEWRAGLWDLPEKDPRQLFGKTEFLGEVKTQHVVTRHKVQRLTRVWKLSGRQPVVPFGAAESDGIELKWVSIRDPEVAVGSALSRTLKAVLERYL